jgi:hypothetical protein
VGQLLFSLWSVELSSYTKYCACFNFIFKISKTCLLPCCLFLWILSLLKAFGIIAYSNFFLLVFNMLVSAIGQDHKYLDECYENLKSANSTDDKIKW